MKKLFPTTLATLVLSAIVATTGMTAAQASVEILTQDVSASSTPEVLNFERVSAVQPSLEKISALPLSNQVTLLDSLKNGFAQKPVQSDPKATLSFERTKVSSIPAPPDPAVLAAKAKEEADKAAAVKAEADKAEAEKIAVAEAATAAKTGTSATQATRQPVASQAAPAAAPAATNLQGASAYQQYAAQELSRRGLNGATELTCLIPLWNHESGWNPNAANPSSTARGIPQIMMNIHYGADWQSSAAGVAYLTNPQVQINKGLDYIIGRYGTPCNAWGTWQSQSWY
jgi:hypothetical protein